MDCARAKRDVGEAYKEGRNIGAIRMYFNTLGGLQGSMVCGCRASVSV
jgi:hypothetical protein